MNGRVMGSVLAEPRMASAYTTQHTLTCANYCWHLFLSALMDTRKVEDEDEKCIWINPRPSPAASSCALRLKSPYSLIILRNGLWLDWAAVGIIITALFPSSSVHFCIEFVRRSVAVKKHRTEVCSRVGCGRGLYFEAEEEPFQTLSYKSCLLTDSIYCWLVAPLRLRHRHSTVAT